MRTCIEYTMDNGPIILVKVELVTGEVVKVPRGGMSVVKTGNMFTNATAGFRGLLQSTN